MLSLLLLSSLKFRRVILICLVATTLTSILTTTTTTTTTTTSFHYRVFVGINNLNCHNNRTVFSTWTTILSPPATAQQQQQQQRRYLPHSVAICAIQKGGQPYLEEWVDYNYLIGFDKIYLYDNSDEYELQNWTYNPFHSVNKDTNMLDIVHFPGRGKQLSAYRHCAARILREQMHSWVAFLDLDEFLVLHHHQYIFELIEDILIMQQQQQQHQQQTDPSNSNQQHFTIGGIAINWYIFDYNNHTKYQPLPLTYRFQRREVQVNLHVKTVVNIAQFRKPINPHAFQYRDDHAIAVDTHGHVISHPTWFHPNGPTDVAVIHHMNFKSVEEYHQRCARGRADVSEVVVLFRQSSSSSSPLYCRSPVEILHNFQSTAAANAVSKNLILDTAAWDVLVRGMSQKYANLTVGKTKDQ
jgi:hypothetical protein